MLRPGDELTVISRRVMTQAVLSRCPHRQRDNHVATFLDLTHERRQVEDVLILGRRQLVKLRTAIPAGSVNAIDHQTECRV